MNPVELLFLVIGTIQVLGAGWIGITGGDNVELGLRLITGLTIIIVTEFVARVLCGPSPVKPSSEDCGEWVYSGGAWKILDSVVMTDVPNHSENNAAAAAALVNQRNVGRNRGGDVTVYVSDNPDSYPERNYVKWMNETVPGHSQSRAESAGVHVVIVSENERDARTEGYWR